MAIANITNNILTDSGVSTSSLLPLTGGTLTGPLSGTSATFSDIVTNTTGGYRTLASQGYILRNDANNPNLGGLTRRSYWAGGAALDTQIFAETGYGIFLNVNGSSTAGLSLASTGAATFSSSVFVGSTFRLTQASSVDIQAYTGSVYTNLNYDALSHNWQTVGGAAKMVLTNGGNVGIGITSLPSNVKLKIKATSEGTDIGLSSSTLSIARSASDTQLNIGYYTTPDAFVISSTYGSDGAYKPLAFATSDTERMRITSGGNVVIGGTTVQNLFATRGNLTINGVESILNLSTSDTNAGYLFHNATNMFLVNAKNGATIFSTNDTERMRITSGGVINTTSRLNVNGAGDNSLFSLINNGTTYTLGFSPNATASTSTTLTITTATTTWIYNGTGTATWTLPNPSGTNQMFWIRNAGTGTLTLNAFSGTNIVNTANSLVSSITIAVGATALIQQDGNIRSYQLQ